LLAGVQALLAGRRESLGWQENRLRLVSPARRLQGDRQRLDDLSRRLNAAQAHGLALAAERLRGLESHLLALDPLAVLGRGYAVVTRKADGRVVMEPSALSLGDDLHVRVRDGEFEARVSGG
jgi:exodeoxyribonuclease VII large subunit